MKVKKKELSGPETVLVLVLYALAATLVFSGMIIGSAEERYALSILGIVAGFGLAVILNKYCEGRP